MKKLVLAAPLLFAASACSDQSDKSGGTPTPPAPGEPRPKPEPKKPGAAPAMNEMRKFDPLTEAKAREVLHAQLDGIAGDEFGRQTLLYLADLKDPAGLEAAKKLLEMENGKYVDLPGAAIALETMLVYGDAGAGARTLELGKQFDGEDAAQSEDFEYLARALARVEGAERGAAVAKLIEIVKTATNEQEDDPGVTTSATVAVAELARLAAPEAKETLATVAADKKLSGRQRGAAVAGLLRLRDPRAPDLAEKLLVEAMSADEPPAAGAQPGADVALTPDASEVVAGLGVEGAVEASPYVRKALEKAIEDPSLGAFVDVEAPSAWIRIFAHDRAPADLLTFLRDWAKNDDSAQSDSARALFGAGDDSATEGAAAEVKAYVAMWPNMADSGPAVEILDVAARRGLAAKPAFRTIVDTAAQISPTKPGKDGIDLHVVGLNLAAAHAFLKSSGK
jgi:hypothetical protein